MRSSRVAVPEKAAPAALSDNKAQIQVPLVADIHFDYRLALAALDAGADKLRPNPGNISSTDFDVVSHFVKVWRPAPAAICFSQEDGC